MDFFAPVVLVLLIVAISLYVDQRRTQLIKTVAREWEYTYWANGRHRLPYTVNQFNLFSRGRNGKLTNLIQREQNSVTVSVGEYAYTTGSGRNRRRHRQTVVFIDTTTLSLPQFFLVPENALHKIGKLFGYQDINFNSHPNFSKRYLLRGPNEIDIRAHFHEGVLNFFEGQTRVCVEGAGSTLMYYYSDRLYSPRKWQQLIGKAFTAYEQFRLS